MNIRLKTDDNLVNFLQKFTLNVENPIFSSGHQVTEVEEIIIKGKKYYKYINEYWTPKQRQANALHEISYRACFKPQLPRFFIELLTCPKKRVYDPFSGRGTTAIEAGILDRNVVANDINPISRILCEPRFYVPDLQLLEKRLDAIHFEAKKAETDLSMFYHE